MCKSLKFIFVVIFLIHVKIAAAFSVGEKYSASFPVSNAKGSVFYKLPLPKGVWEVSYVNHRTTNSTNQPMVDVGLILIEDNFLKASVEITAASTSTQTRWNDEPCKLESIYHKNNYGTRLWTQKCLTLNPITFLQKDNKVTNDAIQEFARRGIRHDFNAIRFAYTRYGDLSKFLIYKLSVFPSVYGLDNKMQSVMNASPWHPANAQLDPEKSKFINELVDFSERFVKDIDMHYEEGVAIYTPVEFVYSAQKK
jgi:hypothetical protein